MRDALDIWLVDPGDIGSAASASRVSVSRVSSGEGDEKGRGGILTFLHGVRVAVAPLRPARSDRFQRGYSPRHLFRKNAPRFPDLGSGNESRRCFRHHHGQRSAVSGPNSG